MVWKPWYESLVEIDSAEERTKFVQGVFGGPKPMSSGQAASMVSTAALIGFGLNRILGGGGGHQERRISRSNRDSDRREWAKIVADGREGMNIASDAFAQNIAEMVRTGLSGSAEMRRYSELQSRFESLRAQLESAMKSRDIDRAYRIIDSMESIDEEGRLIIGPLIARQATEELDRQWQGAFETLSSLEPTVRLILLQIDGFLEERGERGTARARRFDQLSGSLDVAFADLRKAFFTKNYEAALTLATERIQPAIPELRALFSDVG